MNPTRKNTSTWGVFCFDDAEAFNGKELERPLYLAWTGDGKEIVRIIEENGMKAEWEGSDRYRIAILPSSPITRQEAPSFRCGEECRFFYSIKG